MKISRALLAGLCLISAAQPAFSSTTQDEQAWVNLTVMGTLTGKVVYFAEVQPRFGDGVSRLDQLLLRPAIGVKLSPTMTLYQGYARVITKREGARDLREHRSFQ